LIVVGIDPDSHGGVAGLDIITGKLVFLEMFPISEIKPVPKDWKRYDLKKLYEILSNPEIRMIMIEAQQVFPGQGSVTAFTISSGFHLVIGMTKGLGLLIDTVRPKQWQKEYMIKLPPARKGLEGKDKSRETSARRQQLKDMSLDIASELVGQKIKEPGLSDSILIAEFGRRILVGA